jgi:hypothetical protein
MWACTILDEANAGVSRDGCLYNSSQQVVPSTYLPSWGGFENRAQMSWRMVDGGGGGVEEALRK